MHTLKNSSGFKIYKNVHVSVLEKWNLIFQKEKYVLFLLSKMFFFTITYEKLILNVCHQKTNE